MHTIIFDLGIQNFSERSWNDFRFRTSGFPRFGLSQFLYERDSGRCSSQQGVSQIHIIQSKILILIRNQGNGGRRSRQKRERELQRGEAWLFSMTAQQKFLNFLKDLL